MSEPSKEFETEENARIGENTEKQDEKFVTNLGTTDPEAVSREPNRPGDASTDPESRVAELQA
ncbi:MAG: hypothetical protein JO170_14295, partial [Verrucomicrobia bacterium]|nr:hypothetical protein [Verrucomicrobiota bacterium]